MTDEKFCGSLFQSQSIDIVFHACAYKHVPMLEDNIISGVRNNLESADLVFSFARKTGVKRVILVSSDKAVRPTNVMGATKRACELLALWHSNQPDNQTIFTCVRFGNVLGSSGSVLPKFMEQVRNGGPITITHPDITRYFMLIPEAVSLVLQAGTSEERFCTFLLNMGKPIKIVDMAKDLLQLMGKQIDKDVKITFTGLRPGEKLHEELNLDCEELLPVNEDFSKIGTIVNLSSDFRKRFEHLRQLCLDGHRELVKAELFGIIRPYESLPKRKTPPVDALPVVDLSLPNSSQKSHTQPETLDVAAFVQG